MTGAECTNHEQNKCARCFKADEKDQDQIDADAAAVAAAQKAYDDAKAALAKLKQKIASETDPLRKRAQGFMIEDDEKRLPALKSKIAAVKAYNAKMGAKIWFLTEDKQCVVRPCFGCIPECNQAMEDDAWHIKIALATTGMTLTIPEDVRDNIANVLPVKSITLNNVGYSGLIAADSFSEVAEQAKKAVDGFNNLKREAAELAHDLNMKVFSRMRGIAVQQDLGGEEYGVEDKDALPEPAPGDDAKEAHQAKRQTPRVKTRSALETEKKEVETVTSKLKMEATIPKISPEDFEGKRKNMQEDLASKLGVPMTQVAVGLKGQKELMLMQKEAETSQVLFVVVQKYEWLVHSSEEDKALAMDRQANKNIVEDMSLLDKIGDTAFSWTGKPSITIKKRKRYRVVQKGWVPGNPQLPIRLQKEVLRVSKYTENNAIHLKAYATMLARKYGGYVSRNSAAVAKSTLSRALAEGANSVKIARDAATSELLKSRAATSATVFVEQQPEAHLNPMQASFTNQILSPESRNAAVRDQKNAAENPEFTKWVARVGFTQEVAKEATAAEEHMATLRGDSGGGEMMNALRDLKAYCLAAKAILAQKIEDGDLLNRNYWSAPRLLIDKFGKLNQDKDVVVDFAQTIGALEAGPCKKGIALMMLQGLNAQILKGQTVLLYSSAGMALDPAAFGLEDVDGWESGSAEVTKALAVSTTKWEQLKTSLEQAPRGKTMPSTSSSPTSFPRSTSNWPYFNPNINSNSNPD